MKKCNLALLLIISVIGCKPKEIYIDQSQYYNTIIDCMKTELNEANDSIVKLNKTIALKDSIYLKTAYEFNSCNTKIDSLSAELFVANYKLGRIKEYCNIVKRDNSQLQFLRGWINRVLED